MLRVKRGPCTVGFLPICLFLVVYRLTGQKREALCTGMSYEEELRSPLAVRLVLNMCFVLLFSVMVPPTMTSSTWAKSIRRSSTSYSVCVCVSLPAFPSIPASYVTHHFIREHSSRQVLRYAHTVCVCVHVCVLDV